MSDVHVIAEGLKGKTAGSEILNDEVAEEMTGGKGGKVANVELIEFDWRQALTRQDIDENTLRARYAAMSDEDLLAAAYDLHARLDGMAAYSSSKATQLNQMRPRVA
jgi:hypothetical protein